MKPSLHDNLIYELSNEEIEEKGFFQGSYRVLLYDGYLRYSNSDLEINSEIEDLKDEIYHLDECLCSKIASNAPQYPNESSIVKKLEKSGIGRPSTYASLIATLYNRNYTELKTIKGEKKDKYTLQLTKYDRIEENWSNNNKLPDQKKRIILTDLGKQVLEYLMNHFSMIINVEFTSLVEKDLDRVANGEIQWESVVGNVYDSTIQKGLRNSSSSINKPVLRELGEIKDELVILKNGKFGPYVTYKEKNIGLSYFLKDNPTEYNDITLELIEDYIQYPINLGSHEGSDVMIHIGPYGKYMKYNGKNIKIPQKDKYKLEDLIRLL